MKQARSELYSEILGADVFLIDRPRMWGVFLTIKCKSSS